MKKSLILLAILAFSTGAIAQDNAAKLALAREVISAMHADRMFDQMSVQMQQMAAQSMNLNPANITPEQKAAAAKAMNQVMALSMETAKGLIAKLDTIYAEVYSESELNAMKAFFSSADGQSMLAKQPQVMGRLQPFVQEMQKDLVPKIRKLAEEARAEAAVAAAAAAAAPAAPAAPTPPPAPAK